MRFKERKTGVVHLVLTNPGPSEHKVNLTWLQPTFWSWTEFRQLVHMKARSQWSEHSVMVDLSTMQQAGGGVICIDGNPEPVARFTFHEYGRMASPSAPQAA